MKSYYNDNDKYMCAWLRRLIKCGLIAAGDIDDRPIQEVKPNDVKDYRQCHFFAGIGGWSFALRLAGWPDDRPVWTGSCPCQPYSTAGKQKGNADERNLWPEFMRLIRECKPDCVFGEQVEGAIKHGWLDGIQADLEAEDYAVGHCVLGAHSVGAPQKRQRLYWVADLQSKRLQGSSEELSEGLESSENSFNGMANSEPQRRRGRRDGDTTGNGGALQTEGRSSYGGISDAESNGLEELGPKRRDEIRIAGDSEIDGMVQSDGDGPQAGRETAKSDGYRSAVKSAGWDDYRIIQCRDGKCRRIPLEPAFFPLANELPARVVRLRGYGNAIVPQVAAEFIKVFAESAADAVGKE